jgi:hypothetical protein
MGKELWHWGVDEEKAFQGLKVAITMAPVLIMPWDDAPFHIEADSFNYATGAVLSQLHDDSKWHPITFSSHALSDVEHNYDIHDKELLAIMQSLGEWHHYLMGAQHTFEILTDHKNLEYFISAKKLNCRQARWELELAEYDFTLVHKPGKSHGKPDALSRRADHGKGEGDNEDQVVSKEEWFRATSMEVELEGDKILMKIQASKRVERFVREAIQRGEKGWKEENGLNLWKNHIYVFNEQTLQEQIIHVHHDLPVSGHPGHFKTAELVLRTYWWPQINADIACYVSGYERCQRTKTFPAKPFGLLAPNPVPEHNWQFISIDLITQLPHSKGNNAILVVVDQLSKMICLTPINGEHSSEGLTHLYCDQVWQDFGIPE